MGSLFQHFLRQFSRFLGELCFMPYNKVLSVLNGWPQTVNMVLDF